MKSIPNYEGLYSVTEDGKVWSDRNKKFLHGFKNKAGYIYVDLWKNNKPKRFAIHQLVAIVYIPNPKNLKEIDHIDNNRSNNNMSNLQWITHKDNLRKSYTTLSQIRNFVNCSLYKGQRLLGYFTSIKECCRFCTTLGLKFSTMEKYRRCGDYVIKV